MSDKIQRDIYPTAEEARAIIEHGDVQLCLNSTRNPNLEAVQALVDLVTQGGYGPVLSAVSGFVLGRAIGKREERARKQWRYRLEGGQEHERVHHPYAGVRRRART